MEKLFQGNSLWAHKHCLHFPCNKHQMFFSLNFLGIYQEITDPLMPFQSHCHTDQESRGIYLVAYFSL